MSQIVNIFTAPAEAFRALREKPTFLLPIAALIVVSCSVIVWYYNAVDMVWFMQRSLEQSAADIPADQRAQILEQIENTPRGVTAGVSAVAAALLVIVLLLLTAGYLTLVSMFTNDGFKFGRWFSLVSWSSFPVVLSSLASLVNLAVNDPTHMPAEELNPLAFRNLLGLDGSATGLYAALLQYSDPTSLWALALMVLGYRQWTGKSLEKAALIVTAPLLLLVVLGLALSA
jgi:hypothetical protein